MIIPNTNVSEIDVACTIGEVVNGYIDTRLSTLCTSDKINPFSKWKPVRYNTHELTLANLQSVNYGLTIVQSTTVAGLIQAMDASLYGYTYNKPTGGLTDPYRIGDFRNYNPSAPLPIPPMGFMEIDNGGNATTNLITPESNGDTYSLGKLDIYPTGMYRGIALRKTINGTVTTVWCTEEVQWNTLTNRTNWTGEVTCYDFMTNVSKPSFSEDVPASSSHVFMAICGNRFNPNPYTWNLTGKSVDTSVFELQLYATRDSDRQVSFRVSLRATGTVSVSLSNVMIQLHGKYDGSDFPMDIEKKGTMTCSVGQIVEWEGTLTVSTTYASSTVYVFLYADSTLQKSQQVFEPAGGQT